MKDFIGWKANQNKLRFPKLFGFAVVLDAAVAMNDDLNQGKRYICNGGRIYVQSE